MYGASVFVSVWICECKWVPAEARSIRSPRGGAADSLIHPMLILGSELGLLQEQPHDS